MLAGRLRTAVGGLRRQPALLALCGAIGLLEVAAWLLVAPFLVDATGVAALGWVLLQRLLLLLALALVLPGCYATVREDLGLRAALRTTAERAGEEGYRLFVSLLASRAVVAVLTAGALLASLTILGVLDTATVWTDAYLGVGTDRPLLAAVGVPLAVVVASVVARGGVGLHDVRAIEESEHPIEAPLRSLCSWRDRARAFVGYASVRAALLSVPVLAALLAIRVVNPAIGVGSTRSELATALDPASLAPAAVVFVATTALARTTLVGYQLATYDALVDATTKGASDEARVGTDVDGAGPSPIESARSNRQRSLLLATLLIVAAMAGVAVIRTADVHPPPAESVDVTPANASETVETAVERTRQRDHITEQKTAVLNPSIDRFETVRTVQAELDRTDRQALYYPPNRTVYATDGRFAMLRSAEPPRPLGPLEYTYGKGRWTVIVGPPYGWVVEEALVEPPTDVGWTLAGANDEELVYELASPDSLAGKEIGRIEVPGPGEGALTGDTAATVVIDRRTATVSRFTVEVVAESADGQRTGARFERRVFALDAVDVEPRGNLGEPTIPERVWDVVWY